MDSYTKTHVLESILRNDIDVDITFTYNDIGATLLMLGLIILVYVLWFYDILRTAGKVLTVDTDCIFMNDFEYANTYRILS